MSVIINAESRQPVPPTSQSATALRANLFSTMTAHADPYELSNGRLINHVKVAHDPKNGWQRFDSLHKDH
jgi:hypothetical protein